MSRPQVPSRRKAVLSARFSESKLDFQARRKRHSGFESLETRAMMASDVVLDWNEVLLDTIRADRASPPVASRALAIVHAAVYDAVNAIERTHDPLFVNFSAPAFSSVEAAAAAAAHGALVGLFPTRQAAFDAALAASLNAIPDGPGETEGVGVGQTVAARLLALRALDHSTDAVSYTPGTEPGDWQPTPRPNPNVPGGELAGLPGLLPGWGQVTPFLLDRPDQFTPDGIPALTSSEYTTAFNEVKELGSRTSTTRTADQTAIARFWANGGGTATPSGHWNVVAQIVGMSQGNTLAENARLFALLNVALADAAIACWDVKFDTDFWRPITAIRAAGSDGNNDTNPDSAWTPLIVTPPFPTYLSGHSTFSGAAAAVLEDFFGTDQVSFVLPSEDASVQGRSFTSFSQAADESAESRLYGGIHFRFDNEDGLEIGRAIGDLANAQAAEQASDYRFVDRLYVDVLRRVGSRDEILGWISVLDAGASEKQVVDAFLNSVEGAHAQVTAAYRDLLGREAEAAGRAYWVARLQGGLTPQDMMALFLSSPEYRHFAGDETGFVQGLYEDVLGRNAGVPEIESWLAAMHQGADHQDVALGFVNSAEFQHLLLNDREDELFLAGWYQDYLGRDADEPGMEGFVTDLARGQQWQEIQAAILASGEYMSR